jgi:HEAT repeat protein
MYLGPEAPPVKVKDVGVGEVFYSTELDLQKALGFVPRINTTYEVALEYLIRGGDGTRGTRVKSAPVTMRVSVPEDKVVDYYISELLAERPREIARRYGDNICPYPIDELVKLGRPAVVKLEALLRESAEPGVRERVVGALGYFGAEAELAIPAMREALKDERGYVRTQTLSALCRLGPTAKDAIPDLIQLLNRTGAQDALTAIGPSAAPSVIKALASEERRPYALWVLSDINPPVESAAGVIETHLKDPDDKVRGLAARALWHVTRHPDKVLPVVTQLLKSKDSGVRFQASETLRRMGAAAKPALPALEDAVKVEAEQDLRQWMTRTVEEIHVALEPVRGEAVEGILQFDKEVEARAQLWLDAKAPVMKERFKTVSVETVRFEKDGGELKARIKFDCLHWPTQRYVFSLGLLDGKGRLLGSQEQSFFQWGGEVAGVPIWSLKQELTYSFGPWDKVGDAVRFRLTVRLDDQPAWIGGEWGHATFPGPFPLEKAPLIL